MVTTLFSQESAIDAMLYEKEQESRREGYQEGYREGYQEGYREAYVEITYKLYKKGFSIKKIAEAIEIPIKELEKWIKEAEKQEKEHLN